MPKSEIVFETIESKALKGNPLGDPSVRQLPVYLPPGYRESQEQYPTVYLLAGFTGSGRTFINRVPWGEDIQQRMDRLISSGACRPMILIMPDCFTRYGGSQYINSIGTGKYRDYLLELVKIVDSRFRTRPDRDYRAIAGKSSGGYGALTSGMEYPNIFGLVADHSGDKYFEACYYPDLLSLPDLASRLDIPTILADPGAIIPKTTAFHQLMNISSMSACYSPNPKSPLGFDWPVDIHTGELIPEIWRRWKAYDPIELVSQYEHSLSSLRLLFFDCGNHDEYHLHLGARLLAKRLKSLNIPYHYEEFDGGHRSTLYRYDVSLMAISAVLPE
jgi:enterochelin esterase family protein